MAQSNLVPLIGILGVAVVGSTIAVAMTAARAPSDSYAFFDPLVDVESLIDGLYVEEPDLEKLQQGAINGMIEQLDDPYTTFVPRRDTEKFSKDLTGEYVGIGAEVQILDGWLTIASPLDGSPSWKAGVMAGDRVIKIDGESTEGKSIDDAIDVLVGQPNTKVVITVERGTETLDIEIIRDHIKVQAVKGFMRIEGDGNWEHIIDPSREIGYVRLTQFTPGASAEIADAIRGVNRDSDVPMGGLILDLRFNPGGLLDEAVAIADMFIDEGTIVSTNGRAYEERVERAHSNGTLTDLPVVVLINGQSASASEVLSGALADHDRAVVIGSRSFGKGSVQTVRALESGAGVLKITEQYYYLPSGRLLHRREDSTVWGVDPTPGYYVPLDDDQVIEMLTARRQQEIIQHANPEDAVNLSDTDLVLELLSDPQLSAAVKVMQHRIDSGKFEPVGIEPNTQDDVELAGLNDLRAQQDRLLRELSRIYKRVEAVEGGIDPESALENPNDFWDDDADITGGQLIIRDKDGNMITTLTITGNDLERWLVDADVEKTQSGSSDSDQ
ncbi:MAG: S41 family peptidase [Phycisphaerales bacterium]|nr:S41 family peptidase [Phycisphaerales bacterium]